MSSTTSNEARPAFSVGSMLLTLHGLFDMPRGMAQVDPRREEFEIVLKPKAQYTFNGHRVTTLELPEATLCFSPSVIVLKNERFLVDFDSPATPSREGSPRPRVSDHATDNSLISSANDLSQVGPEDEDDAGGGGLPAPRRPAHQILLQFPKRSDLKIVIEVVVSVRQRRLITSAARWITPTPELGSARNEIASFSAADGEVARFKILNRFVGLTVGHLSCTLQVPHVQENLTLAPQSRSLVQVALDRLVFDAERIKKMYACTQLEGVTAERLRKRLSAGESEMSIYKSMLLTAYPQYYIDRVKKIVEMYPPGPQNQAWVQASPEELVSSAGDSEEDLIRSLCAELGPEPNSASPCTRRLVFRWYYRLREDDLRQCVAEHFDNPTDLLDYEPDLYMQVLSERFGRELAPPRYNFFAIYYTADERTYFCDTLRFPVNSGDNQYRDIALAARAQRLPLQMTPNERPLEMPEGQRGEGRRAGEVDILSAKYRPEFTQIIPSIADAMEIVTHQNEQLMGRLGLSVVQADDDFAIYRTDHPSKPYTRLLNLLAEQTYISPSSLLAAFIYLDRLSMCQPSFYLTSYNIEKLVVTAARVASKVVDLRSVSNRNFANAFSLSTTDMNKMEELMLKLVNFDFFLGPEEFNNYARLLDPPQARRQMRTSLRRGTEESIDLSHARSAPVIPPGPSCSSERRREQLGLNTSAAGDGVRRTSSDRRPPPRPGRGTVGISNELPLVRPLDRQQRQEMGSLGPAFASIQSFNSSGAHQVSLSSVVGPTNVPNEDLDIPRNGSTTPTH